MFEDIKFGLTNDFHGTMSRILVDFVIPVVEVFVVVSMFLSSCGR